jgi:hypothetical protein
VKLSSSANSNVDTKSTLVHPSFVWSIRGIQREDVPLSRTLAEYPDLEDNGITVRCLCGSSIYHIIGIAILTLHRCLFFII